MPSRPELYHSLKHQHDNPHNQCRVRKIKGRQVIFTGVEIKNIKDTAVYYSVGQISQCPTEYQRKGGPVFMAFHYNNGNEHGSQCRYENKEDMPQEPEQAECRSPVLDVNNIQDRENMDYIKRTHNLSDETLCDLVTHKDNQGEH